MAVPRNASILRAAPLKSGVILGVSPSSDPTFDVEIARATSSGVYATVARLTPKGGGVPVSYTDILPVNNLAQSYKARAVKDGWLEGTYTAVVTAKAIALPEIAPNITPLTGQTIGAPLFISTGAPPKYGRTQLPSAYRKPEVVYPFEFVVSNSANTYVASATKVYPGAPLVATPFYAKSNLPSGSSVAQVDWLYYRPSTKGSLRFRVQRVSDVEVTTTLIDYTATGTTGNYTKMFTSGFAVTDDPLLILLDVTSSAGTTASVYGRRLEFAYKQPNLAVGV